MSVLDLKTDACGFLQELYSAGPLLRHAVSFSWNNPLCHHREIQLSAHSLSSFLLTFEDPAWGPPPPGSPLEGPSSPTIQVGAPPLVSPWAPHHQILPTFPAARIEASSMMCNQCLLTKESVSDFLTDILGKGLFFQVVIRIRPQCLST